MTDAPPVVLNERYELRGLLGRGGMAEVHRGFDRLLHREVAVKLMHPHLAGAVDRRRFAAETRVLASLNDPHLVTLLDAGVDDTGPVPRPWLVMELVTGPTLAQRLAAGPLPREEVAVLGAGLARALVEVHRQGVVHRDVKPANVLVTAGGEAKLADFGVARMMGEHSDLTVAGHTVGTAAYLAPEQIGGRTVTGASDVYALGLVLLEALTGRRAYPGSATEAAFARLHHGPLIPVSLGASWTRLLEGMTASDPAQRLTALEAHRRLTDLADTRAATSLSAEPPLAATGSWPAVAADEPTGPLATGGADAADAASTAGTAPALAGRRLLLAAALAVVLLVGGVVWIGHGAADGDAARAAATGPRTSTPSTSTPAAHETSRTPTPASTSTSPVSPVVVTTPTHRPARHHARRHPHPHAHPKKHRPPPPKKHPHGPHGHHGPHRH